MTHKGRSLILGIVFLLLGLVLWWSVGLASADESSCEYRLGTVQEQLTDAKAVAIIVARERGHIVRWPY